MLTPQQVRHYKQKGYVLVSGIFTKKELDRMEKEFDGILERRLKNKVELDATWGGDWKEKYKQQTIILHSHDVQFYSAEWAKVLLHEKLTEAFADLIGPNVQLHHTKLFLKPPEKGSAFPMHQDYPYFPHANHTMMAGVIHLTDATEEMGCLHVYPGSHKLGPLPLVNPKLFYLDPKKYPIEKSISCPAKRGDVLLFSYLTIHGSGINSSKKSRKTVLIQVRDPEDLPTNDYHTQSHAQGLMLRGVNSKERKLPV